MSERVYQPTPDDIIQDGWDPYETAGNDGFSLSPAFIPDSSPTIDQLLAEDIQYVSEDKQPATEIQMFIIGKDFSRSIGTYKTAGRTIPIPQNRRKEQVSGYDRGAGEIIFQSAKKTPIDTTLHKPHTIQTAQRLYQAEHQGKGKKSLEGLQHERTSKAHRKQSEKIKPPRMPIRGGIASSVLANELLEQTLQPHLPKTAVVYSTDELSEIEF